MPVEIYLNQIAFELGQAVPCWLIALLVGASVQRLMKHSTVNVPSRRLAVAMSGVIAAVSVSGFIAFGNPYRRPSRLGKETSDPGIARIENSHYAPPTSQKSTWADSSGAVRLVDLLRSEGFRSLSEDDQIAFIKKQDPKGTGSYAPNLLRIMLRQPEFQPIPYGAERTGWPGVPRLVLHIRPSAPTSSPETVVPMRYVSAAIAGLAIGVVARGLSSWMMALFCFVSGILIRDHIVSGWFFDIALRSAAWVFLFVRWYSVPSSVGLQPD